MDHLAWPMPWLGRLIKLSRLLKNVLGTSCRAKHPGKVRQEPGPLRYDQGRLFLARESYGRFQRFSTSSWRIEGVMPIDYRAVGDSVRKGRDFVRNGARRRRRIAGSEFSRALRTRNIFYLAILLILPFIVLTCGSSLAAQHNVLTWHNNNARTGEDLHETILKASTFSAFMPSTLQPARKNSVGRSIFTPSIPEPATAVTTAW